MHISDKTATKLLKELEEIDLIQRIRQGQGKPTRIYVKNFMDMESIRFLSRKSSDSVVVELVIVRNRKGWIEYVRSKYSRIQ